MRNGQLANVTFGGRLCGEAAMVTLSEIEEVVKLAQTHNLSISQMTGNVGLYAKQTDLEVRKAVAIMK